MTTHTYETQPVALAMDDGSVALMRIVTRATTEDGEAVMEREVTDEVIAAEIAKAGLSDKVTYWARVDEADIPDAPMEQWRLVGGQIVVADLPLAP